MATLEVGAHGKVPRATNHELPLVPFIDFLLCLVAFLLVTAVWMNDGRLEVNARVPGPPSGTDDAPETKALHVTLGERAFKLAWRQGSTVIATVDVPRTPSVVEGNLRFLGLREALERAWQSQGEHRTLDDPRSDLLVLHSSNTTSFAELAAVMDAAHAEAAPSPGDSTRRRPYSIQLAID